MSSADGDTWTIVAGSDIKTLGWTLHLPPGQVSVIKIERSGWAHRQGIQIGDELVALNGLVAAEMSEAKFTQALQSRPLAMTLQQGVWEVHAGRQVERLGFSPHLPPGTVTILDVESGGWAEGEGIEVGDEIVGLNDEAIAAADMSEKLFMKLLKARPLTLTMRAGEPTQAEQPEIQEDIQGHFQVVVESGVQTLGLTPHLPPGPVIVLDVVAGGWADKAGIQVGDEIMTLNNDSRPAAEMSEKMFMKILRSRPLIMTLRPGDVDAAPDELVHEKMPSVLPPLEEVNADDEYVVKAGHEVQTLGLGMDFPPGPVIVTMVMPGGWAESAGLHIGDEIVTMNDEITPAAQMSSKAFKKLLMVRPLEITVRQGSRDILEEDELGDVGDAVVIAGHEVQRFGFTPQFPPGPVIILDVEAGGWAESEGIAVDDEILLLNDTPASQMSEKAFKKLMKARPVRMVMRHGQQSILQDEADDVYAQNFSDLAFSSLEKAKEPEPAQTTPKDVQKTPSPPEAFIGAPDVPASAKKPEKQDSPRVLRQDAPKIYSGRGEQKTAFRDDDGTAEFYARAAKEQLEQQDKQRSAEIHRLRQGMNEQSARHEDELARMQRKHEEYAYLLKLGIQDDGKDAFYAAERKRMQELADAKGSAGRVRLEAAELARAREDAERARHEAMNLKMQLADVAREEAQRSKKEAQLLREQLKDMRQPPLQAQHATDMSQGSVVTVGAKVKSLGFTRTQPPGQVIVLEVQAGTWAESVNMQPGDEILAMSNKGEDVPTVNMTETEIKKMMKLRPLQMVLKRMPRNFAVLPPSGFQTRLVISGARQLRIDDPLRPPPNAVCTCTIVGKSQSVMETPMANSSNPWWNYEIELKGFEIGDSLKFEVHDKATGTWLGSKELLGEVTMNAMSFIPDGFDGQVELLNPKGEGTRQKLLLRVELLGTPTWARDSEQGSWTYVVLKAEGIGIRRTPRFDKREELADKLEEGELLTVVERKVGDGVSFMRLDSPRGWIIDVLAGRGMHERLQEVAVEKGSWRYRVIAMDGLEFRSRCTASDVAKNGAGLRVGAVAIVTERVKIRQTTFLKVGVKGWLFDRSADGTVVMAPMDDALAVDDDFAETAERAKLKSARQQEERKKQQQEEEKARRQKEAYDQEVERQGVELAYQEWWRQEEMKHHEAETQKRKEQYVNHDKDYGDLRHQLAMQRHEKALKRYEETEQEEKDAERYMSGFTHLGAASKQMHIGSSRAGNQKSPGDEQHSQYTCVADKKIATLGLTPTMPPGEVIVVNVSEGSWAENQGVLEGDEILRLGDDAKPAAEMSDKAFQKLMGKRPLKIHFRRSPNPSSARHGIKRLDMAKYQGPDPVLEAKIGVAVDAIEKLRRGDGYIDIADVNPQSESHETSPVKAEPDPEPTWAGLTKQLGVMDAAVDDLHWGGLVTDGQAHFQRPKVGPAPSLGDQASEATLPGGLQGFQAQKLASNLASVCAGAFYWSTNMHDHERRQLVELLLGHLRPCAHYDRGVTALIQDLEIERARLAGGWEEPEPVPLEWSPALVQEPRRHKLQKPVRKPPDLSRPQRPLLFEDPVLSSLLAWNQEGNESDRNEVRQESPHGQRVAWEEEGELTLADAVHERLETQQNDTYLETARSDWGDPRKPKRRPKLAPSDPSYRRDAAF